MSNVVTISRSRPRAATVSALLCGDGLTMHLQRAVLAYVAKYGSDLTLLEVERTIIKQQMQMALRPGGVE